MKTVRICERRERIHTEDKIREIAEGLAASAGLLAAIGDETRRHIILEMLKMGRCEGVRVGEITEKTNLSRPAVSHHLQIMKKAGIIALRKEGTKNYYYFDPNTESMEHLIATLRSAAEISKTLPSRNGEE